MSEFNEGNFDIDKKSEEIKSLERQFFDKPWMAITGAKISGVENLKDAQEKTKFLWESLSPVFDTYIDANEIPCKRLKDETDDNFFSRLISRMYDLNQQIPGCWKDCWPTTALEVKRTNCAFGSLIAARALVRSGFQEGEVEFGFPGPLTHAIVFVKGRYLDQANGVVVPVKGEATVDGIKTYLLDVDETNQEISSKVPFRQVPVSTVDKGVITLITNLNPMIEDSMGLDPNPEALELVQRFGVGNKKLYGDYAYDNLMLTEWNPRRMMSNPIWQKEMAESSKKIESSGQVSNF